MALSAGNDQNQTTSRVLNKLQYAVTDIAADITTATTSDILLMFDQSDNYEPKYADSANVLEMIGTTATAAELSTMAGILATTAELNRAADVSTRLVAGGSALTVTEALHDGKIIKLDTAAGTTCTLPAASGSGARFRFHITTVATSNSHIIKVANSSDTMVGVVLSVSDDAGNTVKPFFAAGTDDTITLNRTTTGSTRVGEWIELVDAATNLWQVFGCIAATGTEATPFSATV